MRAVSDEMVLTLSAAGTADDVAAKISAFAQGGPQSGGAVSCRGGWRRASGAILRTIEALS